MDKSKESREIILKSARKSFLQHGYHGAKMQQIADQAEVNKALLHYHFKDKDLLFEQVFLAEWKKVSSIFNPLTSTLPYSEKISAFIQRCQRLHDKDSLALPFILSTFQQQPEKAKKLMGDPPNLSPFLTQVSQGMEFGFLKDQPQEQVLLKLLALGLFLPATRSFSRWLIEGNSGEVKEVENNWWETIPEILKSGF